jgi:hypothetical protein
MMDLRYEREIYEEEMDYRVEGEESGSAGQMPRTKRFPCVVERV